MVYLLKKIKWKFREIDFTGKKNPIYYLALESNVNL